MAELVLHDRQDVEDFVRGCAFYGTGGGGDPKLGLQLLLDDLAKSGDILISDPSVIRDDAWVCSPYLMGSIAPRTKEILATIANRGLVKRVALADRLPMLAALELQSYANVEIEAIVPSELGGAATATAIDVAMALGKKVVNGDWSGRAVPEFQCTVVFANLPTHPTVYVDEWGDVSIVKTAINYDMAEALGKMLSVASLGLVGGAGLLMRGREMKKTLIPNTLSDCLLAGQTISDAVAHRQDPGEAVAAVMKGWILFRGKVSRNDWEDREGYMWGNITVDGRDRFNGHTFKVFYKNENQVTWFDGEPHVTSPDLVEIIRRDSGEPVTNTEIKQGDEIAILGVRGPEVFRTSEGLNLIGPKHFGYDISYRPIEKIMEDGG